MVCPKQCPKIERVVLLRIGILGLFCPDSYPQLHPSYQTLVT